MESVYSGVGLSPHGRISSKVIFITNKFDCQIANYGLPGFRDGFAPNWKGEDLLWSSPEILRNQLRAPAMGSLEGDVWSIAVIISELVNHATPYAKYIEQNKSNIEAVLDQIAAGEVKPELSSPDRSTPTLEKLLSRMNCIVPTYRVSMVDVSQTLKSLLNSESVQTEQFLVKVVSRVTAWTDRLETAAQAMMHAARKDRQRLIQVLSENVPASVARQIAAKNPVEPRVYEDVSLLLLDMPDFVLLGDVMPPDLVIKILESVHNYIASLLADHPLINQLHRQLQNSTMLCACGLPEPWAENNSVLITLFALHLIYAFCSTRFEGLKFHIVPRCAVAVGDCVGGLLLDNGRYKFAVLGETLDEVNIVLRHGSSAKLLCTEKFVHVVEKYERFIFRRNGSVKMKNKDVKVYWLQTDVEPTNTNQPRFLKSNPLHLKALDISPTLISK